MLYKHYICETFLKALPCYDIHTQKKKKKKKGGERKKPKNDLDPFSIKPHAFLLRPKPPSTSILVYQKVPEISIIFSLRDVREL